MQPGEDLFIRTGATAGFRLVDRNSACRRLLGCAVFALMSRLFNTSDDNSRAGPGAEGCHVPESGFRKGFDDPR